MNRAWMSVAVVLLALGAGRAGEAVEATVHLPRPYLRVTEPAPHWRALDIGIREFRPADGKGPVIALAGASHIGTAAYYKALQRYLDEAGLVLYEGIRPDEHSLPFRQEPEGIQVVLARALGLVFQIEALSYDREHFRPCDMTMAELRAAFQEAASEEGFSSGEMLITALLGNSVLTRAAGLLLTLAGSSPEGRAQMRWVLIEALGAMADDPALAFEMSDAKRLFDVILTRRNEKVLEGIQAALADDPPAHMAVFYGAAHLGDLEQVLVDELKYRPVRTLWIRAMAVDVRATGMSEEWMRFLTRKIREATTGPQP